MSTRGLKGFSLLERDFIIGGQSFKLKELTVAENDACIDAARQPDGDINGRTHIRMMITKSCLDPKLTVDDIASLPNRVYLRLAEAVSELNSIDDALDESPVEEGEEEGNA